jgi:hypothetical protein
MRKEVTVGKKLDAGKTERPKMRLEQSMDGTQHKNKSSRDQGKGLVSDLHFQPDQRDRVTRLRATAAPAGTRHQQLITPANNAISCQRNEHLGAQCATTPQLQSFSISSRESAAGMVGAGL